MSVFSGLLGGIFSAEAQAGLQRAQAEIARANAERAYWDAHPSSVKYVERIVLQDDAMDMVLRDGVWELPS